MTPAAIVRHALDEGYAARPPAELLARYAADRDPEAFAGLVHQFGPVVLGTCRRVLGPSADSDDAFQAVFVALARNAGRFRDAQALPAWLHRVALRISRKVVARRHPVVPLAADPADPADPLADVAWRDVRRVLDDELDQLPEPVRGPVVLCWLDGLTRDEAAARLGVSAATVKRRLEAGRELLRARLVRRGLAPTVVAAAALDPIGLRATVPPGLLAAAMAAARTAAPAAGLRWVAVLAAGVVAAGVGWGVTGGRPAPPATVAAAPPAGPDPAADADPVPKGVTAVYGSLRDRIPGRLSAAAVSPDGKWVAVAGWDGPVRVYTTADWKPVRRLDLPYRLPSYERAGTLAFSPDGRHLGYVREDENVFLWDVPAGRLVKRFGGGRLQWTPFAAFTPDGRLALSDKDALHLFDPATGREVAAVPVGRVVRLSPDGRFYLRRPHEDPKPAERAELILGEVRTGRDRFTLAVPGSAWMQAVAAFAPNGRAVAAVLPDESAVEFRDTADGGVIGSVPLPKADRPGYAGAEIGYSAGGESVWLSRFGGDALRWDAATRKELPPLKEAGGPPPREVFGLPGGKTLLTPTGSGWVRRWDAATGKEVPFPGRFADPACFALSRDGKTVAAGDGSGRIDLLDAGTGRPVRTLRETGTPATHLQFSPDGRRLAVDERRWWPAGSDVEAARVLNVADGAEARAFGPDPDDDRFKNVRIAGFIGADAVLVGDRFNHLRAVDLATGAEVRRIKTRGPWAVSPDGRTLAAEVDGAVALTDVATGKELRRVAEDGDRKEDRPGVGGFRLAWAADGKTLAVGVPANPFGPAQRPETLVVVDPATGAERARFVADPTPPDPRQSRHEHPLVFSALAVSPDGKRVLAAVANGHTVCLWEVGTGRRLADLPHEFPVDGAAFTPDGAAVLTFGRDGVGYRWDLNAVIAGKK